MKLLQGFFSGALLCVVLLAGAPAAQPPRPAEPPPRDPTQPSPQLIEAMRTPAKPGEAPAQSVQPVFTLRARVIARDRPPAALLDVDGRLFVISKDSLFQAGGRAFHVKDISADGVLLEVNGSNMTFMLR